MSAGLLIFGGMAWVLFIAYIVVCIWECGREIE